MSPFRQVAEKRVPHQVLLMRWAPRRDLVALANNAGEVTLHRLSNFQRVWRLAPQEPTGTVVTALAWRPDGKVLAVGYGDTGQLVLCDVEKAAILYSTTSLRDISCMHWVDVAERRLYNAQSRPSEYQYTGNGGHFISGT
uniref:Anaphase-promoting complex subunit 4-like WD40 domain-containing protein n=1 Tax=Eptatretus burgeri TaxID=7764 RepID=A0A8C4QFZ1_EPTBU